MDDVPLFRPNHIPQNEVIFGVYGTCDWILADNLRRRYTSGKQTLETSESFLVPQEFSLSSWVIETGFESFTFIDSKTVLIYIEDDNILQIRSTKGKIEVTTVGDVNFCKTLMYDFRNQFTKAENLIEWVYNARGDEISVPLNYRKAITSAYPWLNTSIENYISEYLNSTASILILIGPPGTGKTTFIKNIIHQAGGNAKVAYDERILSSDDFFAGFMESESNFLIMEDADTFLASRQDGNTMMHKFLNVSDGLVSAADKKLIFSTNLPNINDIDSALLRAGRCFDTLHFRALTRQEASAVLEEIKSPLPLPDGNAIVLADLFGTQRSANSRRGRSVGFI